MSINVRPGGTLTSWATAATGLTLKAKVLRDSDSSVVVAVGSVVITEPTPQNYKIAAPIPSDAASGPVGLYVSNDNGVTFIRDDDEFTILTDAATDDWRPTLDEIGARLSARTITGASSGGSRANTFNENTKPTGTQVDLLIDDAQAVVAAVVGVTMPAAVYELAKYAVICHVALGIERGYYPSKSDDADATYQNWVNSYMAAINALKDRVNQSDGGPARGARIRSIQLRSPDGLNDPWVTDDVA